MRSSRLWLPVPIALLDPIQLDAQPVFPFWSDSPAGRPRIGRHSVLRRAATGSRGTRAARALTSISRAVALSAILLGVWDTPLRADATYRRMFVTEASGNGKLSTWALAEGQGGLAGGDKICQNSAEAAGLASPDTHLPVFRAWLSTATDDAYCHVQGLSGKRELINPPFVCNGKDGFAGPWLRTNNQEVFDILGALIYVDPISPPANTEFANFLYGSVWTGSNHWGAVTSAQTCADWLVNDSQTFGRTGSDDHASLEWTDDGTANCGYPIGHLYCFEQGSGQYPVLPTQPGAQVFVTPQKVLGDMSLVAAPEGAGGLAGADAICEATASAAGLPSPDKFLAFLSDDTTAAADRFTIPGPWNRVDGNKLADSVADFTSFSIVSDLRYSDGTAVATTETAWTGTLGSGAQSTQNCANWTSPSSGASGKAGYPYVNSSEWLEAVSHFPTFECSTPRHLYCFSDVVLIHWGNFETGDFYGWSSSVGGPP